ncbi:MAG: hypothetical protein HFH38_00905 [Lachnospiraceae bacterium]|jgi:hypothetical protein|nr:hypothetical protein [Lachnospiraceae bacterium]
MKCSICGRKLSNPRSRELGYGPVCYKRKSGTVPHASKKGGHSSTDEVPDYNLPRQMSVDDYLQMISAE